jgi:hypothetical protein
MKRLGLKRRGVLAFEEAHPRCGTPAIGKVILKHQGTRMVNFEQVGPNGALLSFCGVSAALFARL